VTSKSGRDHSIAIHQDADLWLVKLLAGQKVSHSLAGHRHAWVHIAEGEIILNGTTLSAGDAAAVDGENNLQLSANKPSQALLFDLN
jgi:redox-sensitive bicupin YhaK (pirin superfamily)